MEVDGMTPTDVLREIRKMPLSDRRLVRDEIDDDLSTCESNGSASTDLRLFESMKEKGILSHVPNRLKGKIERNEFNRVNVIGKPVSQTILEDRD